MSENTTLMTKRLTPDNMPSSDSPHCSLVPIEIEYSPEEAEIIRECAAAEGLTVDEFNRQATQRYIKENSRTRRVEIIPPIRVSGFPFFNTNRNSE